MNKVIGIIPARYGSTRFPGKPLAMIGPPPHKHMFLRVYEQSKLCPDLDYIILATDNDKIYREAKGHEVPVVLTNVNHPSGTDRCLEAAQILELDDTDIVVCIQGDQPALHPEMLSQVISPFSDSHVVATTLMRMENRKKYLLDPDSAKIVTDNNFDMIYMSRSVIPYTREEDMINLWIHVGICAFRMPTLRRFVELGPGKLESIEGLEQLRFIENKIPLKMVITRHIARGVDRPRDIKIVEKILESRLENNSCDDKIGNINHG